MAANSHQKETDDNEHENIRINQNSAKYSCAVSAQPTDRSITSRKVFRKQDFSTISAGSGLNPLEYDFEFQENLSNHLQTLGFMNCAEFEKVERRLSAERERFQNLQYLEDEVSRIRTRIICDRDFLSNGFLKKPHCVDIADLQRRRIEVCQSYWIDQLELSHVLLGLSTDHSAANYIHCMARNEEEYDCEIEYISAELDHAWNQSLSDDMLYNSEPAVFDEEFLFECRTIATEQGKVIDSLLPVIGKICVWRRESYRMIGKMCREVSRLKKEEKRCYAASEFARSLAIAHGPFDFFKLPRELRNAIYKEFLVFDYNVTVTTSTTQNSKEYYPLNDGKLRRNKIWTHPIFQINRRMRKEAAQEFYRLNSFVCRSFRSLPMDLGHKIIPQSFWDSIRDLTITWPSLGSLSVTNSKVLRTLKGLKFLNIYINWYKLLEFPGNTLGGIHGFRSLISLPYLERVQIFQTQLTGEEGETHKKILDRGADILSPYYWGNTDLEPKPRFQEKELMDMTEAVFDRAFSTRMLGPQNPGTVYTHGRRPFRPSTLWPKCNARAARQEEKRIRHRMAIGVPEELEDVEEWLNAVQVRVVEKRKQRLSILSTEKVRLLVEKAEREEWAHRCAFFESLPFHAGGQ